MRLSGLNDPDLERGRAIIERQGGHLARLLDDLLDLSRVTHGKIELRKQIVDVGTVVADAVQSSRSLIDGRSHHLAIAVEDRPLRVEGDPTRLAQIVVNLLNNAARYTAPGGRIELSAGADDAHVVLRVKDTGAGIPRNQFKNIFEPFTQLRPSLDRSMGGLGIGLALVRKLVELHGGTVAAHSDGAGQGSEFAVRLPLVSHTAEAPSPQKPPPFVHRRVLLIEDNHDGREMLANLLRLWGHEVEETSDGARGLDMVLRQPPDVALVDIGLPGLDGYELARRARAAPGGSAVRLIAVTGYGQPEDRRRAAEAGFDGHFVKPVDLDRLARILADLPR
jgi:CheY-like chemotaxis protein